MKCRSCSSDLKQVLIDLGDTPLSNSYLRTDELHLEEPHFPLKVFLCTECWLVQLPMAARPEDIFTHYAYYSSYSESWLRHAEEYVDEMVGRYRLNESHQVIELASNDGYLLQYFVNHKIPVLGIEPAANVARAAAERGIPTLVRFFGTETAKALAVAKNWADLLLGNNVLAHVPDLNDFIAGMKILLKPDGVITMEFPHLMRLMQGNQFDTIYHEHFSYFSFLSAERAFERHGITLFDVKELTTHGGSLRIYARHEDCTLYPVTNRVVELREREIEEGFNRLATYQNFARKVEETKQNLLSFLRQTKQSGKVIVGYGAPAKGNTLLNYCGVQAELLRYTVDRNPHKQGQFLPGSHIPIYAPERIRETKPDFVLILPWNLEKEIASQMDFIHEWGGRLVVPIPEVRVIP
jgi:SAM-dependent methyltransferase